MGIGHADLRIRPVARLAGELERDHAGDVGLVGQDLQVEHEPRVIRVRRGHADGALEVELGRLAQQRGGGGEVKRFGERMVQDHTRLNADLQRIAAARGVPLPTKLGREREAVLDQISRLSGAEFDSAYSKQVVMDHQRAVASFDQQALTARDPELKAWAAQALPTLREHLQTARALSPNVTLGQ